VLFGICEGISLQWYYFYKIIFLRNFGQERTMLNWHVVQGGLKRVYSEGHSTLSLRLFWAAFLKEACMKGLLNEFMKFENGTICSFRTVTVRTVRDNTGGKEPNNFRMGVRKVQVWKNKVKDSILKIEVRQKLRESTNSIFLSFLIVDALMQTQWRSCYSDCIRTLAVRWHSEGLPCPQICARSGVILV
jgi:hypothetical protein